MLRVLCRTPSFVEYAEKWQGRNDYLVGLRDKLSLDTKQTTATATTKETPPKEVLNDKQRLQMLKKRGLDSDEKVSRLRSRFVNILMVKSWMLLILLQIIPLPPLPQQKIQKWMIIMIQWKIIPNINMPKQRMIMN